MLLFDPPLHILESPLQLELNLRPWRVAQALHAEKTTFHIPYIVEQQTERKTRNLVSIYTMSVCDTKYFEVSIDQSKSTVLVGIPRVPLFTNHHETVILKIIQVILVEHLIQVLLEQQP